jgi:hypothetical protein
MMPGLALTPKTTRRGVIWQVPVRPRPAGVNDLTRFRGTVVNNDTVNKVLTINVGAVNSQGGLSKLAPIGFPAEIHYSAFSRVRLYSQFSLEGTVELPASFGGQIYSSKLLVSRVTRRPGSIAPFGGTASRPYRILTDVRLTSDRGVILPPEVNPVVAGSAAGRSFISGIISALGDLVGFSAGSAAADAILSELIVYGELVGNITSSTTALAFLGGLADITGSVDSATSSVGSLGAIVDIAGSSAGSAFVLLVSEGAVAGSSDSVSTVTATLSASGALAGTVSSSAVSTAILSATGELEAGSSDSVSTVTATASATGSLVGTVSSSTTTAATLNTLGGLIGTVSSSTASTATLSATGSLVGTVSSSASSTATLTAADSLAGQTAGLAVGAATLTAFGALVGQANGVVVIAGSLTDGSTPALPSGFSTFVPTAYSGNRDANEPGTRIAYIDPTLGSDVTGEYYYWDGTQVVDSTTGTYGTDPLNPTGTIQPFATATGHLRQGGDGFTGTRHPDWVLMKRGESFPAFGSPNNVGVSPEQPALIGAYGNPADPRPTIDISGRSFFWSSAGRTRISYTVCLSLDMDGRGAVTRQRGVGAFIQVNPGNVVGDPHAWHWFEDMRIRATRFAVEVQAGPIGDATVTLNRCYVGDSWDDTALNQGVYCSRDNPKIRAYDSVFYRNGYPVDPTLSSDPERNILDRNFYLGGGTQLGAELSGIISAYGGSGGPQLRHGGIMQDSLVIEGYWFTSASSNGTDAQWLAARSGSSFEFRDNVQLVWQGDTPNAPSTWGSISQPGNGWIFVHGFGGTFERNIISGQVLTDLGVGAAGRDAINLEGAPSEELGTIPRDVTVRDNIVYEMPGLNVTGTVWDQITGFEFTNNVWVDRNGTGAAVDVASGIADADIGTAFDSFSNNAFYTDQAAPFDGRDLPTWLSATGVMNTGNTVAARSGAAAAEGWTAPTRTLKTYCEDVLGLTVTSLTGMPEFFALAEDNRIGAWDERLTGRAVVNYIREGFGLPALVSGSTEELVGTAAGSSTVVGILVSEALIGTSAGTSVVVGTIIGAEALIGTAAGTSVVTGTLTSLGGFQPSDIPSYFGSWTTDVIPASGTVTTWADDGGTYDMTVITGTVQGGGTVDGLDAPAWNGVTTLNRIQTTGGAGASLFAGDFEVYVVAQFSAQLGTIGSAYDGFRLISDANDNVAMSLGLGIPGWMLYDYDGGGGNNQSLDDAGGQSWFDGNVHVARMTIELNTTYETQVDDLPISTRAPATSYATGLGEITIGEEFTGVTGAVHVYTFDAALTEQQRADMYAYIASVYPSAVVPGSELLTGTSAGSSTVSGTLVQDAALVGTVAGSSATTGTLAADVALVGTVSGSSTVSGSVVANGVLVGTVAGSSATTGILTADSTLAGTSAGSSTVSGSVVADAALTATSDSAAVVSGALSGAGSLAGAIIADASLVGSAVGVAELSGVSTAAASVVGSLTAVGDFVGSSLGDSTASASLTALADLSGVVLSSTTSTGILIGTINVIGSSTGIATTTGTIESFVPSSPASYVGSWTSSMS